MGITGIVFSDRESVPCPFCGRNKVFCKVIETKVSKMVNGQVEPILNAQIVCHGCGARVGEEGTDGVSTILLAMSRWETRA